MEAAKEYFDKLKEFANSYGLPEEIAEGQFPNIGEVADKAIEVISSEISIYVELFAFFATIIIFVAIVSQLSDSLVTFVNIAAGLIISLYVIKSEVFSPVNLLTGLSISAEFTELFVPIFATVTALSGKFTLSTLYGGASLLCIELFSKINTEIAIPVINATVSIGVFTGITGGDRFSAIFKFLRNTICFAEGALASLILGLMSLNGFAAKGTDTLLFKAGKLVSGSVVPVIGSAISGGYETVAACFTSASTLIGSAGIFIIIALSAKAILRAAVFTLCAGIAKFLADSLRCDGLAGLFSAFTAVGVLVLGSYAFELLVLTSGIALILVIG